jgi:hypothetical protein
MRERRRRTQGVSLAKGPVGIIGLALLAYGLTGFVFGGRSFTANPVDGTVNGDTWLGIEVNGWSNLLFIGAGALLLFGAPLHWGAKGMALVVGLALGAASVISIADGEDVFGIFAANGRTMLAWGAVSVALLVVALLPRVGGRRRDEEVVAERSARGDDAVADGGRRRAPADRERARVGRDRS